MNASEQLVKLLSIPILSLTLALLPAQSAGQSQSENSSRYPNELPRYKLYDTATWKTLEPLVSTMADVRRVLGEPTVARDVSRYTEPYPGDAFAKSPVFTYEINDQWQILVYFVKYCSNDGPALPVTLGDRLFSIDLLPKKPISFTKVVFPVTFKKRLVTAFHGEWNEYADGSGLVYAVFTRKTAYGDERPGDLNRIVYSPSDESIRHHAVK